MKLGLRDTDVYIVSCTLSTLGLDEVVLILRHLH